MMPAVKRMAAATCVLGGLLLVASPARPDDAPFASRLHQVADPGSATSIARPGGGDDAALARAPGILSSLRYRPRRANRAYDSGPLRESYTEFHGGFVEPDGNAGAQVLFGARMAVMLDPHVALGGMLDWSHRSQSDADLRTASPGPGGTTITTERLLASSTADLVPFMTFLQVGGDESMSVIPYA